MTEQPRTIADKRGYREIKDEIFQRIKDNLWGPGTQLPGEVVLAAEFGCARATVNRAMQELSDDGIIERRRKGGSRVKLAPMRQVRFEIPLVRVEVQNKGAAYKYKLVSRTVVNAPRKLVIGLGLAATTSMLHIKCLHVADDDPYQYEERWINLAAVPRAESADFSEVSPNEWLVSEVPYTNAEVRLSAARTNKTVSRYLGTTEGDPVFLTERTTWLAGIPVTNVHLFFAPGYQMVARY